MLGIIAIGLATSFVVSVWGVRNYPGAAFFLMPSRAWELLAGAITFLIPTPRRLGRLPREVLAASGLGAIGYALWNYTQVTPFPGVAALAPVGGTAALIWANTPTLTLVGRCLAMRPLVFLGLLSYSLYLWHWPILVFVRYCMPEHDAIAYVPGAVALAFVASYLSWRFVETPARRAAVLTDRALVGCWLSSILFLAGVGAFALVTNGAMHRFSPKTRELLTTMSQRRRLPAATTDAVKADRLIRLGSGQAQPTVALVGDSHANVLAGAVDDACSSLGLGCVAITHGGTLPLLGFRNSRQWAADDDWAGTVLDYIVNRKFQVVILAGHWQRDGSDSALGDCLRRTVEALRKAGVRVIILADTPDHTTYTPQQLLRCLRSGISVSSLVLDAADHERQVADSRAAIDAVLGAGVEVLDPSGALRDENGDFPVVVGDECMYFDSNHLTVAGARRLIPLIRKTLESHSVAP